MFSPFTSPVFRRLLPLPFGSGWLAGPSSLANHLCSLSVLAIGLGVVGGCSESNFDSAQSQGAATPETDVVRTLNEASTQSDTMEANPRPVDGAGLSESSSSISNITEGRSQPSVPLVSVDDNLDMARGGRASEHDAGLGFTADAESGEPRPVTIFVAGDSIVSNYPDTGSSLDQAGWGQMLPKLLTGNVTVVNRARGGRTALWFSLEGELDRLLDASQSGDYLFVEFGTNDSHRTAEFTVNGQTRLRYADPDTDFKQQLTELYIRPARQRGVQIVLVTPPPRNSAYCTGGNSLGRWAQAMRELGVEQQVPVANMNTRMVEFLQAICPAPNPENIYFIRPDGSVDGTHFQEGGARRMASFILDDLAQEGIGIENYLNEAGRP